MSADGRGPVQTQLRSRLTPVAETAQSSLRARLRRVRGALFAILQTGVAAGLAWFLARLIVGSPDPFFAPAAAVISVGLQRGQPLRRSVELSAGVAIGIAVAFLLRSAIGLGSLQIGAIVALTIVVGLLVDASVVLVNQAAISAVLVMTLPSAALGTGPDRFFDALIGGAVALVIGQLVFVRNPTSMVVDLLDTVLAGLAKDLRAGAAALERGDLAMAQAALDRLRELDGPIAALFDALARAREAAAFSPVRRSRGLLEPYAPAVRHADYAVRNGRVLLRSIASAIRTEVAVPPELVAAVRTLAEAVEALAEQLERAGDSARTRGLAIEAGSAATQILAAHNDLRTTMIIGQIRATAVDLLRASGLEGDGARAALPAAQPEDV
jgi:uncharacterized membrane protein YgaE (UPF0421/DUF939 family)